MDLCEIPHQKTKQRIQFNQKPGLQSTLYRQKAKHLKTKKVQLPLGFFLLIYPAVTLDINIDNDKALTPY